MKKMKQSEPVGCQRFFLVETGGHSLTDPPLGPDQSRPSLAAAALVWSHVMAWALGKATTYAERKRDSLD
jgi:hypothetical protein